MKQHDAKELAHGYSRSIRALDYFSIATFFVLEGLLAFKLYGPTLKSPWLVLAAFLLGYIGADFVSGFVHWMADTWGSVNMPVIGKALLRPFREHHVDPRAITRHDFVETNGNNCLISLWVGAWAVLLHQGPGEDFNLFCSAFMGSLILWVLMTNQFHKWSHLEATPGWIAFLQKTHLILPPAHHDVHHTPPFHKSYAITAGWTNYVLNRIGFYPFLERCVTATTGLVPRADDIGERAALAVVAEAEAEAAANQPDSGVPGLSKT